MEHMPLLWLGKEKWGTGSGLQAGVCNLYMRLHYMNFMNLNLTVSWMIRRAAQHIGKTLSLVLHFAAIVEIVVEIA